MTSNWDQELPNLTLDNVRVHSSSLSEAWKDISTDYLVRSVLVMLNKAFDGMPFDYDSVRCTTKDLYDAIAATYGLDWIQDRRTGVTWFHPMELAYDHILTTRIQVTPDHFGLPMQSGVIEPLGSGDVSGITAKQWGSLFRNTFDYAVDVPADEYTIRDILNLCCVANPTKTFFVQVRNGGVFVTAVNLVSDELRTVPAGALHIWDMEIGQKRGNGAPTQWQVMSALAHPETKVRHAARNYLEAIIWNVQIKEWMGHLSSNEQAIWTCLGVNSVLVRSEGATHQASIEMMGRLATDDFLAECEPGLAVMTALDLARLTKDARALKTVAKRHFRADDLVGVISDVCRVAALSGYVRKVLQEKNADALVEALAPLARIVHSHNAGKLEFRLTDMNRQSKDNQV